MVIEQLNIAEIWTWLKDIADPEIPALSILDLGIVRDVQSSSVTAELIVTITPTYSGCPAMEVIAQDIRDMLRVHGVERVRLETRLSPAWTTDWLTEDARERLREYGIAPPSQRLIPPESIQPALPIAAERFICPRCASSRTTLISRFGSTPCKALYKCLDCLEPFDAFKRH